MRQDDSIGSRLSIGCLTLTVLVVVFSILGVVSLGGSHLYWLWFVATFLEAGLFMLAIVAMVTSKWALATRIGIGFLIGLIALFVSCGADLARSL
jgi:hypothetical protein